MDEENYERPSLHATLKQLIREIIENATKSYVGPCRYCYKFGRVQQFGCTLQCNNCGFVFDVSYYNIEVYSTLLHMYFTNRGLSFNEFIQKLNILCNQDFVLDEEKIARQYWPSIVGLYE